MLLLYVFHMYTDHTYTFIGSCAAPRGVDPERHGTITGRGGLVAYSESTWRRPYKLGYDAFEYGMYLYRAPVSFAAKRLKVVALSSAEAEYAASSCACHEIVFVRNVLADLGFTNQSVSQQF